MTGGGDKSSKTIIHRSTPGELSRQLGVSLHEVLAAIESAQIDALENEQGLLEFELKPVLASVLENKRLSDVAENSNVQRLLRECLATYQDSIRQMIRDENKTAYQIKQMTESRFLEVLGQLSVSLGRVEAFVAQSSRVLSQIDMRIARSGESLMSDLVSESKSTQVALNALQRELAAKSAVSNKPVTQTTPPFAQQMTNNEHWLAFEAHLTRVLTAAGTMSENAQKEWFEKVKVLLGMGSLELRLNGQQILSEIRPALMNNFADLLSGLPTESDVLPAFEIYFSWIRNEIQRGYPAALVYLIILLNRGVQLSWSGFLCTFVNEG